MEARRLDSSAPELPGGWVARGEELGLRIHAGRRWRAAFGMEVEGSRHEAETAAARSDGAEAGTARSSGGEAGTAHAGSRRADAVVSVNLVV